MENVKGSKEDENKATSRVRQKKKRVRLGKYVLGKDVGFEGFGTVYEAVHTESGELVAIKKFRISRRSKEQIESIQREIDLLRNLSHENIIRYIGHKQGKKYLFIIMEYCEGGSLLQQVKKLDTVNEDFVAKHINQVLAGLEYLHHHEIIHGDIKGSNILLGANSAVKLVDFGVSARTKNQKVGHESAGTPYWMAPEVILMNPMTSKCDIWSVGCVVIELLTGKPPYFNLQAISALYQIIQDPCPPLPENISKLCRDFLEQCFRKDPKIRPSARELRHHSWIRLWIRNSKYLVEFRNSKRPSHPNLQREGQLKSIFFKTVTSFFSRYKKENIRKMIILSLFILFVWCDAPSGVYIQYYQDEKCSDFEMDLQKPEDLEWHPLKGEIASFCFAGMCACYSYDRANNTIKSGVLCGSDCTGCYESLDADVGICTKNTLQTNPDYVKFEVGPLKARSVLDPYYYLFTNNSQNCTVMDELILVTIPHADFCHSVPEYDVSDKTVCEKSGNMIKEIWENASCTSDPEVQKPVKQDCIDGTMIGTCKNLYNQ